MKILKIVLTIFISLFSFSQTKAQLAAEIPTSYDVSATGAFQYSLPIRIPPGIKNMVPQLAITYSSQAGDGNMGVGWSLSGLSAITRGPSTLFHDGYPKSVNFSSDALFLDGQKLVYQGSGQPYLTEVKNFAIIEGRSNGTYNYFAAEYPNGITYEYGSTASSQMKAQGRSDVLTYAVSKIVDLHGNYIEFTYNNSQSTGEYSIASITYGLNSNTIDDIPVTINFGYSSLTRPDENIAYIAGSEVASKKLLTSITINFSDGASTQANQYTFVYDDVIHSRLVRINELRDGVNTLEPIEIQWGEYADNEEVVLTDINSGNRRVQAGDFNGDGFSDLVCFQSLNGNTNMEVYLNDHTNGVGGFLQKNTITLTFDNVVKSPGRIVFDYDGDGLDDIVVSASGIGGSGDPYVSLWLIRANGSPGSSVFDTPVRIHYSENDQDQNTNFAAFTHYVPGDFDGDGKSEIIVFQPYNFDGLNVVEDYEVFIVAHEYGSHQIEHIDNGHIVSAIALDNNGDGKDEFLFTINAGMPTSFSGRLIVNYNSTTYEPTLYQTSTTWPVEWLGFANYPGGDDLLWPADFNGDGKTDLLTMTKSWTPNWWKMAYSDGIEAPPYIFSGPITPPLPLNQLGTPTMPSYNAGWYSFYPGDFNGDGLSDILEVRRDSDKVSSHYYMYYSTGMGFIVEDAGIQVDGDYRESCLGDFNGDGQLDLMAARSYDFFEYVTFHKNNKAWKVESIAHAQKTVNVEYETIPNDIDYSKMATGHADFLNRTIPVNVAKRVYDDITVDNKYAYKGLMYHKYGLGMRGFQKFTVENTLGQRVYNTYNLTARIPFLAKTQMYDAFGSLPYGKLITYGQIDTNGGQGGKCRIIIPYTDTVIDYITAQKTYTTIIPDTSDGRDNFFKYGSILSTKVVTTDLNDVHNSTQRTTYFYKDWITNKGKPDSVVAYSDMDNVVGNAMTRSTNYTYNSEGETETATTDPGTTNENITTFYYDLYGNVIHTSLAAYNVPGTVDQHYGYSIDGKFVIREEGELGYETTFDYGNLEVSWGNVLSKTNIKGDVTEYEYDAVNRLIREEDMVHNINTYTNYSWAPGSSTSQVIVTTTNSANISEYATSYDKYGQVLYQVSPIPTIGSGFTKKHSYGPTGLLATVVIPDDQAIAMPGEVITTYTYDDYNRIIEQSDNQGLTIETDYSYVNGKLHTTVTNVGASSSKTSVTCGGILRQVLGSGGDDISYTYFGNGTTAITTVNSGPGSQVFTNTIDDWGRTLTSTQPDAGTVEFEYNALGQITKENRATGTEYTYTYDEMGRVLTKHETGQPNPYTYEYSDVQHTPYTGEMIRQEAPNGYKYEYFFTNGGKLEQLKETTALPGGAAVFTSYYYNPDGTLFKINYFNDMVVEYTYDAKGYVHAVELAQIPGAYDQTVKHKLWEGETDSYDFYSRARENRYYDKNGNTLYRTWNVHDAKGRIKEKTFNLAGPSTPLVNTQYSYDASTGNLVSRSDNLHTEFFTYDNDFDRLTGSSMSVGGSSINPVAMQYNKHGNLIKKSDVPPNTSYPWKYNNYQLDVVQRDGAMTPTPIPLVTQNVAYNGAGMVTNITEVSKNKIEFEYGPDDQRVKAEYKDMGAGGVTVQTKYYFENYERIEYPNGARDDIFYIWAEGNLAAIVKAEQPAVITGTIPTKVYYPVTDHLGSITHLFDDEGMIANGLVEERSFDAWGNPRDPNTLIVYGAAGGINVPKWEIDRGYTGHEHIWCEINNGGTPQVYDNHIINMNGRLYDPQVGRMFSPDKYISNGFNSQDYNKYAYVRNNPLKYTDPTGNYTGWDDAAAFIIGGAFNLGSNIFSGNLSGYGFGETIMRGGSAFLAGGVAGVGALYPQFGGWMWGGATVGATNAWLSGGTDFSDIAQGAATGVLTQAVGGAIGYSVASGMAPVLKNVASPVAKGAVGGAVGGAAVGYGEGFIGGYMTTGDIGAANQAGLNGMWWGAGMGAVAGAASGYVYARQHNINPITGEKYNAGSLEVRITDSRKGNINAEVNGDFNRALDEWNNIRSQYGQKKSSITSPDGFKHDSFKAILGDGSEVRGSFYSGGKTNPYGYNIKVNVTRSPSPVDFPNMFLRYKN